MYGVDTVSRRQYTLYFKNLLTGKLFEDQIPETNGGAVWANDNKTIFYTKNDPQTLRSYRVYKHVLGTSASEDVIVYEETDETFYIGVGKSKSQEFIMISSNSTLSTVLKRKTPILSCARTIIVCAVVNFSVNYSNMVVV